MVAKRTEEDKLPVGGRLSREMIIEQSNQTLSVSGSIGVVDPDNRPSWRGQPVPSYLASWFDQLMSSRHIFAGGDRDGRIYCDVLLTMASGRPTRMLPQITWK